MTNTLVEKPCKAYCIVAMETNLSASHCVSVLRFTFDFVDFGPICVSFHKNTDKTEHTYIITTFSEAVKVNFLHQSPFVLQISPLSVIKLSLNSLLIFPDRCKVFPSCQLVDKTQTSATEFCSLRD